LKREHIEYAKHEIECMVAAWDGDITQMEAAELVIAYQAEQIGKFTMSMPVSSEEFHSLKAAHDRLIRKNREAEEILNQLERFLRLEFAGNGYCRDKKEYGKMIEWFIGKAKKMLIE